MSISIAQVKPLKGKDTEKFIKAFETSGIKKEAIEKANKICIKGFNSK